MMNWPDGSVLYNARETTTTMLAPAAAAVVARLMDGPADIRQLSALLSSDDDPLPDELLDALALHGILRRPD